MLYMNQIHPRDMSTGGAGGYWPVTGPVATGYYRSGRGSTGGSGGGFPMPSGYTSNLDFGPYGNYGTMNIPSGGGTSGAFPGGFDWGQLGGGLLSNIGSQLIGQMPSSSTTSGSTKRTWDQGLAQQQYDWMSPNIQGLLQAADAGMADYGQAKQWLSQAMGPTDISEMKKNWGQLSNLKGQVYDPFRQAISGLQGYQATLQNRFDPTMARQLTEARRRMALAPGMTAAQRGAADFGGTSQALEQDLAQRQGLMSQAATQVAGAQQALGGAQLSGIQAAGQLGAQMSGIRQGDLNRYIAGSQLLTNMAQNNPRLAAIYAILGIQQGIASQTMGGETTQTTRQGGSGLMGLLGGLFS